MPMGGIIFNFEKKSLPVLKLSISNLDELPTYIQDNKEKFKEWLA